ncbi:hypothetical protein AAHE18_12G135400 [Arachis hypogaea]
MINNLLFQNFSFSHTVPSITTLQLINIKTPQFIRTRNPLILKCLEKRKELYPNDIILLIHKQSGPPRLSPQQLNLFSNIVAKVNGPNRENIQKGRKF